MLHGFRWGIGLSAMATVLGGLGMWRAERMAQPELAEVPFPKFAQLPTLPPLPLPPPTLDGLAKQIRVRVVSATSGEPLAGAMVALLRGPVDLAQPLEAALTNREGVALFTETQAGLFTICARGAGHEEDCEAEVGVVAGGELSVDLRLPPGAVIEGQVVQQDGLPAAGVRLMAMGTTVNGRLTVMPTQAVTDAEGRYRLDGVTPGYVRVTPFTSEGQGSVRAPDAEVQAGEVARLDIRLAGFAPVTVHVDPVTNGLGDVDVRSVSLSGPLRRQPDGSWTGMSEAGAQDAGASGYISWLWAHGETKVTLTPGVAATVRVRFAAPKGLIARRPPPKEEDDTSGRFELAGRVFLRDGTPVKGVRVSTEVPMFIGPCGNEPRFHSHHRFDGAEFVIRPMAGVREVYAWLDDGRAGKLTAVGREGERVSADIWLEETGAVVGQLEVGDDYYTDNREVIIVDDMWYGVWHRTRQDGSFIVAGLSPGKHVLQTPAGIVNFNINARERTDLGLLKAQPPAELSSAEP
ncbi:carboxypeptidase regulatory-like domain-containing protein [Myxococcus sp. Y35]|uniref:carboxypeptidase regulatory-like domain-containing protein n=1 Tax=Pseudomyxococcus flavus TaxID=3115648 RepID=UPI003CF5757E